MARSVISIQEGGRSFGDWIKKHSKGIARVTVATHTVSRPVTDANGKVIDHRPFHLSSSEYLGHILHDDGRHIKLGHCRGFVRDNFEIERKQKWEVVKIDRNAIVSSAGLN
jgi:hypothetical protein